MSLFLSCLLTCSSIRLEEQGKIGRPYLFLRVDPVKIQSTQQQVMLRVHLSVKNEAVGDPRARFRRRLGTEPRVPGRRG